MDEYWELLEEQHEHDVIMRYSRREANIDDVATESNEKTIATE